MTDRQRNNLTNAIKMGGVFITSGTMERANIMSTHWGGLGRMWSRDVFFLPVRKKKFTTELLAKNPSFVVNIPLQDSQSLIDECDNLSGKDIDKVKELGLTLVPSRKVITPGIAESLMHLECKVVYSCDMTKDKLDPIIAKDMYIGREFHTIYIGEILRCSNLRIPKK